MYDFKYNYQKRRYGGRTRLLFKDTDSLMYEIETENIYEDLWEDKGLFDNSDYPECSRLYYEGNKEVIGKIKDETAGVQITQFVGLRVRCTPTQRWMVPRKRKPKE